MRMVVATITGVGLVSMVSVAGAQMPTPDQGQPPGVTSPAAQRHGGMGGMMQHENTDGMMCPMMGGPMMGGPMMGGMMMGGMMRGMAAGSDPKAMARVLRLRGDIMKALGEVMLKHAQALEQEK